MKLKLAPLLAWQSRLDYPPSPLFRAIPTFQKVTIYTPPPLFLAASTIQVLGWVPTSAASRNFEKGARSRTHFQKAGQPEYFWATHPFNAKHPFNRVVKNHDFFKKIKKSDFFDLNRFFLFKSDFFTDSDQCLWV